MVKLEDALKQNKFSSEKQKAALNLLYTAWWLKTLISKELKAAGLTYEQFNVLRILKGKHPQAMCVKDIGSRMIEPNSNVPRIINRLVTKKYVRRTASEFDKRETAISLTESAIGVLSAANQKIEKLFNESVALEENAATELSLLLENIRDKK